jgi:hypothetical protein
MISDIIVPSPPVLAMTHSGPNVLLSWSSDKPGFTLQSTTNLFPPVTWTDTTNLAAVIGTEFVLTNNFPSSQQFYRLKK